MYLLYIRVRTRCMLELHEGLIFESSNLNLDAAILPVCMYPGCHVNTAGRYLGGTLEGGSLALTPTTCHHLQLYPFLLTNSLSLSSPRPRQALVNLAVQSSASVTCVRK